MAAAGRWPSCAGISETESSSFSRVRPTACLHSPRVPLDLEVRPGSCDSFALWRAAKAASTLMAAALLRCRACRRTAATISCPSGRTGTPVIVCSRRAARARGCQRVELGRFRGPSRNHPAGPGGRRDRPHGRTSLRVRAAHAWLARAELNPKKLASWHFESLAESAFRAERDSFTANSCFCATVGRERQLRDETV